MVALFSGGGWASLLLEETCRFQNGLSLTINKQLNGTELKDNNLKQSKTIIPNSLWAYIWEGLFSEEDLGGRGAYFREVSFFGGVRGSVGAY